VSLLLGYNQSVSMTFHEYKAENGGAEPGSQISEHLSFSRDDIV